MKTLYLTKERASGPGIGRIPNLITYILDKLKIFKKNVYFFVSPAKKNVELQNLANLGKISAQIFHDLINYLTPISLYIENNSESDNEKMKKYVSESNRELKNFLKSIRSYISCPEEKILFTLHEEITSTLRIFSCLSKKHGIELLSASNSETSLYGSVFRFNQAVSNIIFNSIEALKRSRKRKKYISLSIEEKNEKIFVIIRNNGSKISEKVSNKIFKPFYSTKRKGIGIGLSTCKQIIEKEFNGEINLLNNENGNVSFLITLPKTYPIL